MMLDQLNLNYLRIFEAVYRTRSMTQAAQEMHLTQSGISQHVKSLEETLGLPLFDRIKQKLVPTSQGQQLYESLAPNLKTIENILIDLTNKENVLRGDVNVGLPVVFGMNIVMPLLSDLGKKYPQIRFNINFDLAPKFNEQLLNGSLDFAIVDEFRLDDQVTTDKLYNESLELCCAKSYLKNFELETKKDFENLNYICYDKSSMLILKWFKHSYKFNNMDLKVAATIADALGVAKLISSGMGAGVLPRHQVMKLISDGHDIHIFEQLNTKPLTNQISVAYVKGRTWSNSVKETYNYVCENIKDMNSIPASNK